MGKPMRKVLRFIEIQLTEIFVQVTDFFQSVKGFQLVFNNLLNLNSYLYFCEKKDFASFKTNLVVITLKPAKSET